VRKKDKGKRIKTAKLLLKDKNSGSCKSKVLSKAVGRFGYCLDQNKISSKISYDFSAIMPINHGNAINIVR